MATLDSLKLALRHKVTNHGTTALSTQPLSDEQYSTGFDTLMQSSESLTYQEFTIPQLSRTLENLLNSRDSVSVLEIGPGPRSVLGDLPIDLRRKIRRYAAFEPNLLFANNLEDWIRKTLEAKSPLLGLKSDPTIQRGPFLISDDAAQNGSTISTMERFDVILFCHSMYGMRPKRRFVEKALGLLVERPKDGLVIIIHRGGNLFFDGLVCHQTASFPTGVIRLSNEDHVLDSFAKLIAGFQMENADEGKVTAVEWRKICRKLGRQEEDDPETLQFSAPSIMAAFTRHASALPELTSKVPLVDESDTVKSREARLHPPASVLKPSTVEEVQKCVRWAVEKNTSLTVIGGGHSGHCLWPNVTAINMCTFQKVHVVTDITETQKYGSEVLSLVVAEAGCKTGDIIRQTMEAGFTVPLGARPSVGAGLWLQGGIGHLARLHGLACDAIVGVVAVSVDSGEIICVGHIPAGHIPAGAVRPDNEMDILWGMKGAGTNFGIVISVTFKGYAAPMYSIRNWVVPLNDNTEAQLKLENFDELVSQELPRHCSADAYLYYDKDQLQLGVTVFELYAKYLGSRVPTLMSTSMNTMFGPETSIKTSDSIDVFDADMYMSGMHGGHGSGKTSAFKRCLFLKNIGNVDIMNVLITAMETRPSALCYLHLLHGGGAIGDIPANATAFGCRDWDFACVITGIWPRDQDGTQTAEDVVRWVYNVASKLSPLCSGAYGADLGPDPRDNALAAKAFGPNLPRLAILKQKTDPHNVLAYAFQLQPPVPKTPTVQKLKLIVLVIGDSCAGKDFCADIWVSMFTEYSAKPITARVVSISEKTKREYSVATGAELDLLLHDRSYKEKHREPLTEFFQAQVQGRPQLPEEHFLRIVHDATDIDVLFITGMRDEAPVPTFAHLVPGSRLLEVRVQASEETRRTRQGCDPDNENSNDDKNHKNGQPTTVGSNPGITFNNDTVGGEGAKSFGEKILLPFLDADLERLANMVLSVSNFPRPGIDFRHVLDIAQQPGGLALCSRLLRAHFAGDWTKVHTVACCEAGGFIYASALAADIHVPLALIREAGKLPPPTVSAPKFASHISGSTEKKIEVGVNAVSKGAVVVIDDVLATGKTLCAVLELLVRAGVDAENISVMVVAEFPIHRGREFLRERFGSVNVQSLLVFGGC